MTGNTNLSFDKERLIQINTAVVDSRDAIKNNFALMKNSFDELRNNVTGSQINSLISVMTESLNSIDNKMSVSFEQLTSFLNSQMANYGTTYEQAASALKQALAFIDNNL